MPGLHTDYWQKTCPGHCQCQTTHYCKTCDKDVSAYKDSTSYSDAWAIRCRECETELEEPQEIEPPDTAMERWEEERKLKD